MCTCYLDVDVSGHGVGVDNDGATLQDRLKLWVDLLVLGRE